MKLLCTEYNTAGTPVIVTLGDDALLRNNDDFYFPDFTGSLSCIPQLVVRLCKLGKGVGKRFADRYYGEVGMGIRFYADAYEDELRSQGLPCIAASCFAESAAISPLCPKEECRDAEYAFAVNGEILFQGCIAGDAERISGLIADASAFHTLKIGDFLFCGNTFRKRGLQIGDQLSFSLDGKTRMDFKIK